MRCAVHSVTTNNMAFFVVRVELPGSPSEKTYEILHDAMARAGFARTIAYGGKPPVYQLPHAMYSKTAASTVNVIRDEAASAAKTTGLDPMILAIEAASVASYGLEQ